MIERTALIKRMAALLILVASGASSSAQTPTWRDPARVLVVYNMLAPDENGNGIGDSFEIAESYARRRGVPSANLVGVRCDPEIWDVAGLSGWHRFYTAVRNPVVGALDLLGREFITTLLFCRGVPYQVTLPREHGGERSLDQAMMTPFALGTAATPDFPEFVNPSPYFEGSPGVGRDQGHFSHAYRFRGTPMYLVARLDGPDTAAVMDLIEGALYGDRYIAPQPGHHRGVVYVDTRFDPYPDPGRLPYPQHHAPDYRHADEDMAWCTQLVRGLGFPVRWENTRDDLEIGQRGARFRDGGPALDAPDALFYFGWYNYDKYHDAFEWLPGSAAADLNSNSAAGIHNAYAPNFLPGAFRGGLTCGVGAIAEPYLGWHPFPEVFVAYLMHGYTFAEAAAVSDRTQHWRSLYIGDPLYCPLMRGKRADVDDVSPPAPTWRRLRADASSVARFAMELAPRSHAPDLVTVGGLWGRAPVLDRVVTHELPYRVSRTLEFPELEAGSFYRTALEVRDPAGNVTPSREVLWIHGRGAGPAAVIQSDILHPGPGQPVTIEFAIHVPGGVTNLSSLTLTLDVPALGLEGVDLLALLPALGAIPHGDPLEDETFSLEVPFDAGLAAGLHTFGLRAETLAGPVTTTLALRVE